MDAPLIWAQLSLWRLCGEPGHRKGLAGKHSARREGPHEVGGSTAPSSRAFCDCKRQVVGAGGARSRRGHSGSLQRELGGGGGGGGGLPASLSFFLHFLEGEGVGAGSPHRG
eukprot:COSAG02_NODE_154_length_33067_cov_38.282092_18_plen_112_part_00